VVRKNVTKLGWGGYSFPIKIESVWYMINSDTEGRGTATHFADWVFRKTNPNYQRVEYASTIADRLALGQFAHEQIENLKFWMKRISAAARDVSSDWGLVYSDPHDGSDTRVFYSSRLIVDDKPMRCRPDVVFRDMTTGLIIVVERKVTGWGDNQIPDDAWPNVRAQLWCYGWIDDWVNVPDVILVCQFLRRHFVYGHQDSTSPWIWNYEVMPSWRRSDHVFHSECIRYFNDYGGQFLKIAD
jgi:hypothetical protein